MKEIEDQLKLQILNLEEQLQIKQGIQVEESNSA